MTMSENGLEINIAVVVDVIVPGVSPPMFFLR